MSGIKVFSQPGCGPCVSVISALRRAGIEPDVVDISVDIEGREFIADLGYTGTPVVYIDPDNHWQGMQADRLKALINEYKEVAA